MKLGADIKIHKSEENLKDIQDNNDMNNQFCRQNSM